MSNKPPLMPVFKSQTGAKPFYLRAGWIIFSIVIVLIIMLGIKEAFDYQNELKNIRENLEITQVDQTSAILKIIKDPIFAENYSAVDDELNRLGQLFADNHLVLVNPSGAILADNRRGWLRSPVAADQILVDSSNPNQMQVRWLSQDRILRVAAPLLNKEGQLVAIFINEADQRVSFNSLYQAKETGTLQLLILVLAVILVFVIINWWLFIRPLDQMAHLSRAVHQGKWNLWTRKSLVLELQQINMVFNEMINHLVNQRAAFEALNQHLEDTVVERTAEITSSSVSIRQRAAQLEAINSLIASTAASLDMNSLLATALEKSMQIVQVDKGTLWANEYSTCIGVPSEAEARISQAALASKYRVNQTSLVEDWTALSVKGHPQSEIAQMMLSYNIKASISLPIFTAGHPEPIGLLNLGSSMPRLWSIEETALLEIIARHLGTVIERTQYIEDIRAHNQRMLTLVAQSEQLNRTANPSKTIAAIGSSVSALSKADGLVIFTQRPDQQFTEAWSRDLTVEFIQTVLNGLQKTSFNNQELFKLEPRLITNLQDGGDWTTQPLARQMKFQGTVIWPLMYENKISAFVCCYYAQPVQWKQSEQETLEAFLRQAAAALENARLFEAEHEQRQLAEALREVAEKLTSTLDLDEVLEGILNGLSRVVAHDSADIMLIEDEMVWPVRWSGLSETASNIFKHWRYSVHDLYNRWKMVETTQALVIPDTVENPFWVRTTGLEWVRSYAGAPICQRGEVTGFIDVMSSVPGFYHPEIGEVLQIFANQAAIAMENARLYHNTQQRMAETSALYRAVQPLFRPIEDIRNLAKQITESVTQEFASAHCSILMIDDNRTHLTMLAQAGSLQFSAPDLPLSGPGLTVSAFRSGNMVYSPDVTQDSNYVPGPGATQSRSELAIPLYAGGEIIGVLNLESPEVDAFDERGRRLMAAFAEQAALGLENARLFMTIRGNAAQMAQLSNIAQRRAHEAEILRKATTALSSTLDLKTLLSSILNQVDQVLHHESACIFLLEDETSLRVHAAKNLPHMDEVLNMRFPRNNPLFYEIEQTMRPLTLPDAQLDPRFEGWGGVNYVHGWIGVPLIARNEFVGILTLDRREQNAFTPEEVALAQAFANQVAIAVQNARLYQSTQQRARELEALHTATTSLVSTLDLQKLLERILASATSAIPTARAAAIHLLEENGELQLRVLQGLNEKEVPTSGWNNKNGLWAWVLQEQRPLLVDENAQLPPNLTADALPKAWQGGSLLVAPLLQEDQALGIITLVSPFPHAFNEQDLHLLISFASTATAAIHNAQLHSAVQHLAISDPLTGVYNRRGFYDKAQQLLEESQALDRSVAAIMIDIDYFKRVNDQYGHDIGDTVLRKMAERCRKVLRESDIICRYGGEEFAILLAESELNGAEIAGGRLHRCVTESPIETNAGPVQITVSVGIAASTPKCKTLDQLFKAADLALYQAKAEGRNRVSVWKE